jgi:hypothetical protein
MSNKLLIICGLVFSLNSYALSPNQIASCRQGSTMYNSYAAYLDKYLSYIIKTSRPGSKEFKELMQAYMRAHEDFKDKEYSKLLQVQARLIAEKDQSNASIEAWRIIREATIDMAYVVAGENLMSEQLGRSDEHYQRKIYDKCISQK